MKMFSNWRQKLALALSGLVVASGVVIAAPAQAATSHDGSAVCETPTPLPIGAVPAPFLKLPFRARDGVASLKVTNGWVVAADEETYTGPGLHKALDFEFTRQANHGYGLPVVAAAAGRAYVSYQNITDNWVDPQGVTHRIGVGAGLFVEVRHCNGFVTQYIHLGTVAAGIPYLPPVPDPDVPGDWIPSGIFQSNEVLWAFGVPVKQGQVLGTQGDTGIGLDWNDDFNVQTGTVAPRDREQKPPWDLTQLHFQPYQSRVNGSKQNILDPSDLRAQITATSNPYTPCPGVFGLGPNHLWLTGPFGQPLYAAL